MTDDRPTSTPPAAKLITAQGAVWANLMGMVTEGVIVVAASWLLAVDKLQESNWMIIAGGVAFGPVVARLRGKPAASSIITALAIIPPSLLAGAKGKSLLGLIVFGMSACV